MAHGHDHKDGNYFLEQVCAIGVCGALGAVVITMWAIPNGLNFLGTQFQAPFGKAWLSPLFLGGVIVVAMALIRTVARAITLKTVKRCDRVQGAYVNADCNHEHQWVPCRYVLGMFPVGLYWLGLVPSAFSSHAAIDINFQDFGPTASAKGGDVIRSFRELGRAAYTEESRSYYAGRTAQVVGQVTNVETDRFGLVRYKLTCCAADALPLRARVIVTDTTLDGKVHDARIQLAGAKWVEVKGVIQFRKLKNSDEFVTVLEVSAKDVSAVPDPANPWQY